jgi:hypothetical protein
MDALIAARAEMEIITAELKIRKALMSQVPPDAQYQITIGQRDFNDFKRSIRYNGVFAIDEASSSSELILRSGWNLRR